VLDFLLKKTKSLKKPNYIIDLLNTWKNFKFINKNNEYIENNSIHKLKFTNYYNIDSSNYNYFKTKKWLVVFSEKYWYIFLESYSHEIKIPYSNSEKVLAWFLTDNKRYLLENNIYYFYRFKNYSHLNDVYWFYKSTLEWFWYDLNKTLIYIDWNKKFNFVTKYEKIKLINKDFLTNIWNKSLFLKILSDDLLYLSKDYYLDLKNIQNITYDLTDWKTDEEKIRLIYDWILDNISYSINFKLTDYQIFSWVETFKNKSWVCEWYVKLMSYMLLFSWIDNIDDIRWYVIDAQDFPKIGHAWLRIWDKYYDPTFDDPVWAEKTKVFNEYKYYWLPRDLFYSNRYDYWKLPEYIKNLSFSDRKKIIFNNLKKLFNKYYNSNYLILKPFKFRKEYNLLDKEVLNIDDFKNILKYYTVRDYKFYDKNWIKRRITNIVYYTVDDSNIEKIIWDYFNYNTNWLYLFKWIDNNWNVTYKLTNNVTIK
jgi:hypothetical protein